ncbi:hypothetical protein ABPG74_017962 [Tetrahymena malaccensis]
MENQPQYYQTEIREGLSSENQNCLRSNSIQTKIKQNQTSPELQVESTHNIQFIEQIQQPFILRICNQQQNQNLGDQSSSLIHFPSSQYICQKQNNKSKVLLANNQQYSSEIYENTQQGNKTNESFVCDQSSSFQKTECNESIINVPEYQNQISISLNLQQHKKQDINLTKFSQNSISIQKFNLLQVNQAALRKKKLQSQSADDYNHDEENKDLKLRKSRMDIHRQKTLKKRNNLLFMDYQTQKDIWRTKWIQITSIITKMKRIAHYSSLFFRPNELSELQVKLINDISSDQKISLKSYPFQKYKLGSLFSYENLQNLISFKKYMKLVKFITKYFSWLIKASQYVKKQIKNVGIKVLNTFPLIHDLSFFYILWEAIICITSTILFLYIPFEYSFNIKRNVFFQLYIDYYCQIVLIFDIFVKFNTKSSEQGTLIDQHLQIFENYFKSTFFIDLISMLSLCYNFFNIEGFQFLFFLRILKSFRILEIIREQFLLKMKMFGVISLLYLLGQIIYFGHLFTCLWNYLGLKQLENNKGWMVYYNYEYESVTNRYIQIYYYATITMTTIGYGDFTAQTQLEKIIMIFIAFLSCGIFGYTINQIGSILYDIKQKKDLYHQELAKINKYFKQNNVDLSLQCRARKYIQYLYSDENNDNISSIKSLSNLSEYLQKEIQTDVYIKKLKKIQVFQEIFTDEILIELSLLMKEAFYCHDQCISQNDEENDQQLYFVNNGTILEYCQYSQNTEVKEIQYFRSGQFFGLLAFLQGDNRRKVKYKSVGVSSILKINYNHFVGVLKNHPNAFQKFCFIRDEIKFSNKLIKVNAYCNSCQQQNHILEQCPYLFYEGKKQSILRNYFKKQQDMFKQFKRKQTTKTSKALLNQQKVSQQADEYYIQNIELFSMWDLTENSNYSSNQDLEEIIVQEYFPIIVNEEKKITQEIKSEKKLSLSKSRESLRPTENKEVSKLCSSEISLLVQENEKPHNSQRQQLLQKFQQIVYYTNLMNITKQYDQYQNNFQKSQNELMETSLCQQNLNDSKEKNDKINAPYLKLEYKQGFGQIEGENTHSLQAPSSLNSPNNKDIRYNTLMPYFHQNGVSEICQRVEVSHDQQIQHEQQNFETQIQQTNQTLNVTEAFNLSSSKVGKEIPYSHSIVENYKVFNLDKQITKKGLDNLSINTKVPSQTNKHLKKPPYNKLSFQTQKQLSPDCYQVGANKNLWGYFNLEEKLDKNLLFDLQNEKYCTSISHIFPSQPAKKILSETD